MNFTGHSVFFRLSKIAVLLLYIPFFVVQGFFNFDNYSQNNYHYFPTSFTVNAVQNHVVKAIQENKQHDKKTQVRLNKRFHPENVLYCVGIDFETRDYNLLKHSLSYYTDPLLSLFPLSTCPLRGPPNDV